MTLHNERIDGPIKDMAAVIDHRDVLTIQFTEWDVPNMVFSSGASCRKSEGGMVCSLDCDGGTITVSAAPGGWNLVTKHFNYSLNGPESLFAAEAPDFGWLVGTFHLKRKSDDKSCKVSPDYIFVAIEPGDISPRVQRAENLLNQLGQLLEFPDTVYDDATAEAVRRFQRQQGISPTGSIDEATSSALVSAGFAGGGC